MADENVPGDPDTGATTEATLCVENKSCSSALLSNDTHQFSALDKALLETHRQEHRVEHESHDPIPQMRRLIPSIHKRKQTTTAYDSHVVAFYNFQLTCIQVWDEPALKPE
jgi:hypothetical protein